MQQVSWISSNYWRGRTWTDPGLALFRIVWPCLWHSSCMWNEQDICFIFHWTIFSLFCLKSRCGVLVCRLSF